jgi:hypothetical protein
MPLHRSQRTHEEDEHGLTSAGAPGLHVGGIPRQTGDHLNVDRVVNDNDSVLAHPAVCDEILRYVGTHAHDDGCSPVCETPQ